MAMGIQPEELIAEYCDLKALSDALYRGKKAAAENLIDKAMRKILAENPDAETLSLLVNCLFVVLQYHVFYDFLDRAKLTLRDTHEDRAAMRADWDAWQNGAAFSVRPTSLVTAPCTVSTAHWCTTWSSVSPSSSPPSRSWWASVIAWP